MNAKWRRLLRGRTEGWRRRWLTFVGGYAVVTAAGTAYRLLRPTERVAPVIYEDPLVTALLLGPLVVAAAGVYLGGGLALGLAVGVTPALAYGTVLGGAALIWTGGVEGSQELLAYVLASAAVGVVTGLVGSLVGFAARR